MWIFNVAGVVAVVWVSLFWTVVKKEYRFHVASYPFEQRLEWMAERFFVDSIDYRAAVVRCSNASDTPNFMRWCSGERTMARFPRFSLLCISGATCSDAPYSFSR